MCSLSTVWLLSGSTMLLEWLRTVLVVTCHTETERADTANKVMPPQVIQPYQYIPVGRIL